MTRKMSQMNDYFKVKIESASPMGLVYMLYERAISSLQESQKAIKVKNRDLFSDKVIHAQDCIRELRTSLNLEVGPIAHSLHGLYNYMLEHLVAANTAHQTPILKIQKVEEMLTDLLQTWKKAEKQYNNLKRKKEENEKPEMNKNFSLSVAG